MYSEYHSDDMPESKLKTENFVTRNGYSFYTENGKVTSIAGIDISEFQGDIDWDMVKAAGIDFAMTALFTTVFIQQWIDSKCHIPAVLGVAATLICRLVFGRDYFLIPAMVIIVTVLLIMRKKIESAEENTAGGEADG